MVKKSNHFDPIFDPSFDQLAELEATTPALQPGPPWHRCRPRATAAVPAPWRGGSTSSGDEAMPVNRLVKLWFGSKDMTIFIY